MFQKAPKWQCAHEEFGAASCGWCSYDTALAKVERARASAAMWKSAAKHYRAERDLARERGRLRVTLLEADKENFVMENAHFKISLIDGEFSLELVPLPPKFPLF